MRHIRASKTFRKIIKQIFKRILNELIFSCRFKCRHTNRTKYISIPRNFIVVSRTNNDINATVIIKISDCDASRTNLKSWNHNCRSVCVRVRVWLTKNHQTEVPTRPTDDHCNAVIWLIWLQNIAAAMEPTHIALCYASNGAIGKTQAA